MKKRVIWPKNAPWMPRMGPRWVSGAPNGRPMGPWERWEAARAARRTLRWCQIWLPNGSKTRSLREGVTSLKTLIFSILWGPKSRKYVKYEVFQIPRKIRIQMKMTVQIYRKIRYFCFSGFINHRNLRCRRAKTCKNHRTVYDFGGSKITASKRVPRAFDGVEQPENQRKQRYFRYFFKVRSEPHGIPCAKTLTFLS